MNHSWTEEHQAVLVHWARRVIVGLDTRHFVAIDDLVSEAWIKLFSNRAIDPRRASRNILVRQMAGDARTLQSGQNRWHRQRYPVHVASLDVLVDNGGLPSELACDDEGPVAVDTTDAVIAILARLSLRLRIVLVWRFCENLTHQQIGDRLGVTRERARQLINDALAEAREAAGIP